MLKIKKGDTRNAIVATLSKNGQPIDLEGCTVLISISRKVHRSHCDVLPDGRVMYPLEKSITDKSGNFAYEFIVVYPDGREETFPNDGYKKIIHCRGSEINGRCTRKNEQRT